MTKTRPNTAETHRPSLKDFMRNTDCALDSAPSWLATCDSRHHRHVLAKAVVCLLPNLASEHVKSSLSTGGAIV